MNSLMKKKIGSLILALAVMFSVLAPVSVSTAATPGIKKAIYIIPGYMGSQLYDPSGNLMWVDANNLKSDVLKFTLPLGATSLFLQKADGTGISVHQDKTKDKYGTLDEYKPMIDRLNAEFKGTYDVKLFPYNWLGDVNQSAKELQNDIDTNGYEKVILITHSTGGLVASAYISASRTNKLKVEKAFLIAAPLYGTYMGLLPVETGQTPDIDNMLKSNGISNFLGLTYPAFYSWVQAVTKNAPTNYQLLPSLEYLKLMPQLFSDSFKNPVTTTSDYYKILNGSNNINSNLTNGNDRSHRFLRENTFGGDIISKLLEVDTTVIGCTIGYSTPTIAVYENKLLGGTKLKDMIYTIYGDGTMLYVSAFGLSPITQKTILKYQNFNFTSHRDLDRAPQVLDYLCGQIRGVATKSLSAPLSPGLNDGMRNLIKLNVTCDKNIAIKIFDSSNNEVAEVSDSNCFGFDANKFIFNSFSADPNQTDAAIYMPNTGYRIEFYYGSAENIPVVFRADVATLDADGYKTSVAAYPQNITSAGGLITAFDMTDTVANISRTRNLEEGNTVVSQVYYTNWNIDQQLTLNNIGDTATINLVGQDVANNHVTPSSLTWSSSDETVATVSAGGDVTSTGYGNGSIYAVSNDGSYKIARCNVVVPLKPSSVSFADVDMVPGERTLIKPVFSSDNVTERNIVYDYDKSAGIISIDENGVILALSDGVAEITGTAPGGARNTFAVNVAETVAPTKHILTLQAGTGGDVKDVAGNYESGVNIDIAAQPKAGYSFSGWTSSDGGVFGNSKNASTTFTMPGNDTTVSANFVLVSSGGGGGGGSGATNYTVTFNTNGGGTVASQSVTSGNKAPKPADPSKTGFTFAGWYADQDLTAAYDFNKNITGNTTIYAKWTENAVNEESPVTPTPVPIAELPTVWQNPFSDVRYGDWFYSDIEYMVTKGIFNGNSASTFAPGKPMTRAMFVTTLWRMAGSPAAAGDNKFTDIGASAYYTQAVKWAAVNSVVNGISNSLFAPNNEVTREQMAAILYRYEQFSGQTPSNTVSGKEFGDRSKISDYAKNAVSLLVSQGILSGKPNNLFDPHGTATRAEVAATLHRFVTAGQ